MNDRTLQAVTAQLAAMGCPSFVVGVKDAATASGKMMNREWSRDEVLQHLGWLKHMNVKGNHIYVRPKADWHHLVLVDDLKSNTLERMRLDGVEPALLVETSPQNYQVWISVAQPSRKIVPPEIRAAIARRLAEDYGGDRGSMDATHYGRLAGFTNRKPERRQKDGRYPWVLLREHGGQPASAAADLVAAAEAKIAEQEQQKEQQDQVRQAQVREAVVQAPRVGALRNPVDEYRSEMKGLTNRFRSEIEDPGNSRWTMSKCDFVVAAKMLGRGHDPDAVMLAMREASPDLDRRKAGHVEDYVQRTVRAAAAAVNRENPDLDLDFSLRGPAGGDKGPGPR